MKKFEIYAAIFLLLLIITAFTCLNDFNTSETPDIEAPAPEIVTIYDEPKASENKGEITDTEPAHTPANTDTQRVTKYILKYDKKGVVLISCFDNGKQTVSSIPDININYLTEMDRKSLEKGIELKSEEELYKLIEDYSS